MPPSSIVQKWIELSTMFRQNNSGPRVLPIARLGDKYYFVDERLRQLRNVEDAANFLDYETTGDLFAHILNSGEMVT